MTYLFLILALIAGALVAVQFGVNATLRGFVSNPIYATLTSYAVGTIASLICVLAIRPALPEVSRISVAPWWVWSGGAIGVGYVTISIMLAPKLGAATLIVMVIAGQLLVSLLLDHYGLLGYAARPINVWRVLGASLLVIAVVLIKTN